MVRCSLPVISGNAGWNSKGGRRSPGRCCAPAIGVGHVLASRTGPHGGRMDYFAGGRFTYDWTSHHLNLWEEFLRDKIDTATAVLEIGSFEGRSALFFLQFLPKSRITCVDSFQGSEEHVERGSKYESDMVEVERRFDQNLEPFGDRVDKHRGDSVVVLPALAAEQRLYDVVYVDGDHSAASTYTDARLGWDLLDNDGVMILDDYRWGTRLPAAKRPAAGIEAFLRQIAGEFELLHRDQQVIIRKSR
ncbi:MAG: class I SAM-dependent methyltransferase, partial [Mesorhizobium sp.]